MTTPLIHELLDRDPRRVGLANNGQARITHGRDERATQELRAELETFVCKGQFADALERILERYLAQFDASRQDAVWVSGFFGSGKSHLLKMLAHLWVDTRFEDGQTARGLVEARLPERVRHALAELNSLSRKLGCSPVAAAGSLLGGNIGHVRLSVLSIVLRACGLPEQYPQARFCLWLRGEGMLETVRDAVEAKGRHWHHELNNLYVSPVIASSVAEAVPGFAGEAKSVRQTLIQQYPQPKADISTKEFVDAAREALAPDGGSVPPTIVVLDEVQQYINEATDRAATVTELAEAVQSRFDSRVLLVASGQSALAAGTTALAWLRDRFRVSVELADAEVEAVTREVLLRKIPSAEPAIRETLDRSAGEVSRHLQSTRLATRVEDREFAVGDYPLLRTRRRFWEVCFRSTDASGSRSQIRSQLRILHDSLRDVAERPLGAVIPASDLFRALAHDLVASGVLLNEINTRIGKLDNGTPDGRLKADICGIVFLIGKLPRESGADEGVRADAATLSDLLLDDIRSGSGEFRKRVAETLRELAGVGVLAEVHGEYRIQTRAGAEWERAFRQEQKRLTSSLVEVAARRDELLRAAVEEQLKGLPRPHGVAKVRRAIRSHFGMDPPGMDTPGKGSPDSVRLWVRDGWSCSESIVRTDARAAGVDDPILHVYLPKRNAGELHGHIASAEAAKKVRDERGSPTSPEGKEAREGMNSRLTAATDARNRIIEHIVRGARVFRGGGGELDGATLRAKVSDGAKVSLARLYPRFSDADYEGWGKALGRSRQGSGAPLKAVGWEGPVIDHPVGKAAISTLGSASTGADVRKALMASPFGWPQDAIDAVLVSLVESGHLKAERHGSSVPAKELTQQTIRTARFVPEKVRLSTAQRLEIAGLFRSLAGLSVKRGEETARASGFLAECRRIALDAGGEPPLPAPPPAPLLDQLSGLAGNEQLAAILDKRKQLEQSVEQWKRLARRAGRRTAVWKLAKALLEAAKGELGEVAAEVGRQLSAIRDQRTLLDETDHAGPCVARLAKALRTRLCELRDRLAERVTAATARLTRDPTWNGLGATQRDAILRKVGLTAPGDLRVGTDEQLREELDSRSLAAWRSEIDAVATRERRALAEAARQVQDVVPGTIRRVQVRRGTLSDAEAVGVWITEHERKLRAALRDGPVIVE